jgi:hypothetical protein
MKSNYSFKHKDFVKQYNRLTTEVDLQFETIAAAIYQYAEEPIQQISMEDADLLVGKYDPNLSGYPAIENISIIRSHIYLKLELSEKFSKIESVESISPFDKLSILEFLENHLIELQSGSDAGNQETQQSDV